MEKKEFTVGSKIFLGVYIIFGIFFITIGFPYICYYYDVVWGFIVGLVVVMMSYFIKVKDKEKKR